MKNNLKLEFYTSDHPVMVWNPPSKEYGAIWSFGFQAYNAEGVEIYFPLKPKLCLLFFDNEVSEYRKFKFYRKVIQDELDWINTQIIAMAYRMVFGRLNDFQNVKNCIKRYPELKDINRNRLYF